MFVEDWEDHVWSCGRARRQHIDANHPFKTWDLADFIDNKGYFNLVQFIGYNQTFFPFTCTILRVV
jgi:hypothetical protein